MSHACSTRRGPSLPVSWQIPQAAQLSYAIPYELYGGRPSSNQLQMPTFPGWQMPPLINLPFPLPPAQNIVFGQPPTVPLPMFAHPVTAFPLNHGLPPPPANNRGQSIPKQKQRMRMPLAIVDPNPGKGALQPKKKEIIEPNTTKQSNNAVSMADSEVKQSTEHEKPEAQIRDPFASPIISKAILQLAIAKLTEQDSEPPQNGKESKAICNLLEKEQCCNVVGQGPEVKESTVNEKQLIKDPLASPEISKTILQLAKLAVSSAEQDSEPSRFESENGTEQTDESWDLFEKELENELNATNAAEPETIALFRKRKRKSLKPIAFECPPSPVKIAPKVFETPNVDLKVRASAFKMPDATRKSFASIAKAPTNARSGDPLNLKKLPKTTSQLRILPRPRSQDSLASSSERNETMKTCPTQMNGMQTTKLVYSLQEHLVVAADDNLEFLYEIEGRVLISMADG